MKGFSLKVGLFLCFFAMFWAADVKGSESVSVFVSIVPQKYFVEKIGGDLVDVSVMVLPGASPATYEPKPRQMVAVSKSKIYFAIGVPFERVWLKKIAAANPKMTIVHTDDGIEKIAMKVYHHYEEEAHYHYREEARHHYHEEKHNGIKDPHIWLSPPLVMLQARNILQALRTADPTRRSIYEANYKRFIVEVVDLDSEIREIFAEKAGGLEFMVFHPAWGYFARAYGLKQVPVEIEGKEPKPHQLRDLIKHAREWGIKLVFVQPQFSTKTAELVANAIGGQIAFADPLAQDWANNLREVAAKFKAALE